MLNSQTQIHLTVVKVTRFDLTQSDYVFYPNEIIDSKRSFFFDKPIMAQVIPRNGEVLIRIIHVFKKLVLKVKSKRFT